MTLAFIDAPAPTSIPRLFDIAPYSVSELPHLRAIEGNAQRARRDLLSSGTVSLRHIVVREYFRGALEKWRSETGFSSLLEEQRAHPEYRHIVEMGNDAIPLILEEIEIRPGLIFMALHDITGEDPIAPEHRGRVGEMIQDWLRWGAERGLRRR